MYAFLSRAYHLFSHFSVLFCWRCASLPFSVPDSSQIQNLPQIPFSPLAPDLTNLYWNLVWLAPLLKWSDTYVVVFLMWLRRCSWCCTTILHNRCPFQNIPLQIPVKFVCSSHNSPDVRSNDLSRCAPWLSSASYHVMFSNFTSYSLDFHVPSVSLTSGQSLVNSPIVCLQP